MHDGSEAVIRGEASMGPLCWPTTDSKLPCAEPSAGYVVLALTALPFSQLCSDISKQDDVPGVNSFITHKTHTNLYKETAPEK